MKKWHQKSNCAPSFGNTEVKNHCGKSRISTAANHGYWKASLRARVRTFHKGRINRNSGIRRKMRKKGSKLIKSISDNAIAAL
jgi:hypothetical protein